MMEALVVGQATTLSYKGFVGPPKDLPLWERLLRPIWAKPGHDLCSSFPVNTAGIDTMFEFFYPTLIHVVDA